MIHKRILEAAEAAPDASLEALADDVAGASPELVERVLDEYGDPGTGSPTEDESPKEQAMSEALPQSPADLTEKQRATLEAIAEQPSATQAELAESLDVSRATVNTRLNDIPGFEWTERQAFLETIFHESEQTETSDPISSTDAAAVDGGQLHSPDANEAVEALQERLRRLEQEVDESIEGSERAIDDPELLAKVMRAVLADEAISEAEEVRVLESLL